MPSEQHDLSVSNSALMNIAILSSGSSLMDMLNQQSGQTTDKDDSIIVTYHKNTKICFQQTQHLELIIEDNKMVSPKHHDSFEDSDRLSTLFNTTGRERNSTGPLKQWLYAHQDHPYPNENDRLELMTKTKMSPSQITIWFTNARVKMRKEMTLTGKLNGKKRKKSEDDDLHELKKILDLSISSDDGTNDSNTNPSIPTNDKRTVIAYSSLNNEQITNLRRFGGNYADQVSISDYVDEHTTHLVIGNEEKSLLCPLTMKLFQSIARHLYIVGYSWISECLKQNHIIDEIDYAIRGDIPFGEYHDGMIKSRLSKQVKLFQNCQFFLLCDGCQDKMSTTELTSLIQLCHGSLLHIFPLATVMDDSMSTIVLCKDLIPFDSSHQQQLFELSRSNGVHFLGPEWVLESIVHFALQPFDSYEEKF